MDKSNSLLKSRQQPVSLEFLAFMYTTIPYHKGNVRATSEESGRPPENRNKMSGSEGQGSNSESELPLSSNC